LIRFKGEEERPHKTLPVDKKGRGGIDIELPGLSLVLLDSRFSGAAFYAGGC